MSPGNKIIPVENHQSRGTVSHLQENCHQILGTTKKKKKEETRRVDGGRLLFIPGVRTSTKYSKATMCNQSSFSFRNGQKTHWMKPEVHERFPKGEGGELNMTR